jgi:hypothetical protein
MFHTNKVKGDEELGSKMTLLNSEGTHRDDGNREDIKMTGTKSSQFLVKLDMNKEY